MNNLIERLPGRDRAALLAIAKPLPFDIGAAMDTAGERTQHVSFPTDGFISLVTASGDEPGLEVSMVASMTWIGGGNCTSPETQRVKLTQVSRRPGVRAFQSSSCFECESLSHC